MLLRRGNVSQRGDADALRQPEPPSGLHDLSCAILRLLCKYCAPARDTTLMAINVNDVVQRYRLQLRQIWNGCFYVDPELRGWESVGAFRQIQLPLFNALVAHPLGLEPADEVFGKGFRVIPNLSDGFPSIQVNSQKPSLSGGGIWGMLSGPFKADDIEFTLIDFFDWMPLDYIDLQYYRVMIDRFHGHEEQVGQHALIEAKFANVVWVGLD